MCEKNIDEILNPTQAPPFFEVHSVKPVTILSNGKVIVELIYFLSLDELTLILNRVAEIRAANPLCIDSKSIKALSSGINSDTPSACTMADEGLI